MKTFTIDEIREYIRKQDSMGDILYNLSEENIIKANEPVEELSDCCAAPIQRGLCTQCLEHV